MICTDENEDASCPKNETKERENYHSHLANDAVATIVNLFVITTLTVLMSLITPMAKRDRKDWCLYFLPPLQVLPCSRLAFLLCLQRCKDSAGYQRNLVD